MRINKARIRLVAAFILVGIIAASLWFASPVTALNISFPSLPTSGTLGQTYSFSINITVRNTDLLPIRSIDLQIYNVASPSTYSVNCSGLPMPSGANQTANQTYTTSGGSFSISGTTGGNWVYANSAGRHGYGYSYQDGTWVTENYSDGYGYGFGYGGVYVGETSIAYTVNWVSPSSWPAGTYRAIVVVYGNGADTALTHNIVASFSLQTPAPGPSGDGGGGGGGLEPGVTNVAFFVDSQGVFTQSVTASCSDGKCSVTIEQGTKGLTKEGTPLSQITVKPATITPPPPAGVNVIGEACDFGPEGATFDKPVTITFTYNDNQIPDGFDEQKLVIAVWDAAAGQWVNLVGIIDPVKNTITVQVTGFAKYAILAYREAVFTISGLSISAAEVNIGQSVTISAIVANIGDIAGSYKVTLKINNTVVDTKDITFRWSYQ